jgi:hypothetical protein
MSDIEVKARREAAEESFVAVLWAPERAALDTPRRRLRIIPVLTPWRRSQSPSCSGRAMRDAYMGAP